MIKMVSHIFFDDKDTARTPFVGVDRFERPHSYFFKGMQ